MIPSIAFSAAAEGNGNGVGDSDSVTTSSNEKAEPTAAGIDFSTECSCRVGQMCIRLGRNRFYLHLCFH